MADTKMVIYKGPHAEIRIPEISGFVRGEKTAVAGDRADELVFHKPDQFEYAEGETAAKECPCERCSTQRTRDEANKAAVAAGDDSTPVPAPRRGRRMESETSGS